MHTLSDVVVLAGIHVACSNSVLAGSMDPSACMPGAPRSALSGPVGFGVKPVNLFTVDNNVMRNNELGVMHGTYEMIAMDWQCHCCFNNSGWKKGSHC